MRKMKKIGVAALSMAFLLGVGCTVYNVYAKTIWTEAQIEAEYELLSEFTVPQREVIVNGKEIEAEAVVQLPDGTATTAETVKLKTAGKYTVIYTAESDDKHYVEEESFVVHNNLCSFLTEESSVTWGKYKYAEKTEGLMVRLAKGDTLTLNQPVDMTALQDGEWLIRAFATPDAVGHADFNKLCFQFTDIEDPSITLYFSAKQTSEDETAPYTYCVAGGNGQTPKGFELGTGNLHEEGNFGHVTIHSFGLGNEELCSEYCDQQGLDFGIDFSTMEVYSKEGTIIDLDSAEHFETVWEGFPSGKAYLTIWAELNVADTANFCLYKVGNLNLKQEKVVDTQPPVITIDSKYEEVPTAVKGGCYQYIPEASAKDLSGEVCEVTTKVYYNYQSPDAVVLDVKDGTFETEWFGHYAIVYEATDKFGNLGREIIWIKAEKTLQKPSITLKEEPSSKWTVGEKFLPAEYDYECYSGEPSLYVYATKGKKTYNLTEGFRIEEEGTYTITYELKDCAGQIATYEYELVAKIGDSPVLGQDVEMPRYMITGTEYTFPKVYFNDYRGGEKERKVATGKIIDAKGETKVKAGDTYELSVDNTGDMVSLIFECENASYEVKVPAVKSWDQVEGRSVIQMQNYFVGSGFTCEQSENMVFKASSADGGWCFANQLPAENFSAEIQGIAGNTDYESIILTLTDSKNPEEKLSVELPYIAETLAAIVGDRTQTLKKGVDLGTAGTIAVEYKDGVLYVATAEIRNLDFSGFSSERVYFSMQFKGAGSNAAVGLVSLNNHMFASSKTDKFGAKIVVIGNYGGTYRYGDEIALPIAKAGDVLNPNITFTMTVLNNKEVVKDVNGKELKDVDPTKEYKMKADKYGQYNFVYTAYDSFSEKDETMSYVVHVVDDKEPTIKFDGKLTTNAKVGDTIFIPSYKVSDDVTAADKITVMKYVQDPNGALLPLAGETNAIHATAAGDYKFVVLVIDEANNVCNESWIVTVTDN